MACRFTVWSVFSRVMMLKYVDNQRDKLTAYCDHGHARISRAENAIRSVVIGRKAWLFSDTPKGAHASEALYDFITTATANGLEPYHYLHHFFKKLPRATTMEQLEQLLPWRIDGERLQHKNDGNICPNK